jgi:hypothetical protein
MKIGDKVICVDDSIKADQIEFVREVYLNWIKKDTEYTIRGFTDNDGIVDGMWLEEVHNIEIYQKLLGRYQEPAFRIDRFRKAEHERIANTIENYQEA